MEYPDRYYDLFFREASNQILILQEMAETPLAEIDPALLKRARIAAHTIKGDARTMRMAEIADTAAGLEEIMVLAENTPQSFDLELVRKLNFVLEEQIEVARSSRTRSPENNGQEDRV